MPTVAEQLRHGREALKLDVQQVAEATKLKTDQIRALEAGDYGHFSAPIYLRGSVRTYANLLKLDARKLISELDAELGDEPRFAEDLPAPARKKSGMDSATLLLSRLNWIWAGIIILLLAIALGGNAVYRAWKNRKPSDPLKNLGPGIYQPTEPSGDTLPLPTNAPRRSP